MSENARPLTRLEIERILRRVRGSKKELAERLRVRQTCISQWLQYKSNSARIEAAACALALSIASRLGLAHEEIYFDNGHAFRKRPRRKPPRPCRSARSSLACA